MNIIGGFDGCFPDSVFPAADGEEIKACPRCNAYIMKTNDGSCNRMNCTVCACQFCWLCMQEITDVHYLRYMSSNHAGSQVAERLGNRASNLKVVCSIPGKALHPTCLGGMSLYLL